MFYIAVELDKNGLANNISLLGDNKNRHIYDNQSNNFILESKIKYVLEKWNCITVYYEKAYQHSIRLH